MLARALGLVVLTCTLAFTAIGVANAAPSTISPLPPIPRTAAPEIDPAVFGTGIAIMACGMLLLAERRRADR
jgi:hypothetical protein